jgi:hypothetical protein
MSPMPGNFVGLWQQQRHATGDPLRNRANNATALPWVRVLTVASSDDPHQLLPLVTVPQHVILWCSYGYHRGPHRTLCESEMNCC